MPPEPELPTPALAEICDAWCGGKWAGPAAKKAAAEIERRLPGTRGLIRQARRFHARAAEWAVSDAGRPAAGVVLAACGYPSAPLPHHAALRASARARFAYADPDPGVVSAVQGEAVDSPRVSAVTGTARNPEGLLANPVVRACGAPLSVHLQLCLHLWPPDLARERIAAYGALLAETGPGSTLVMSSRIPGPGQEAEWEGTWLAVAGCRAYAHSPEDIAGWAEAAGMGLVMPGIRDARAWPAGQWPPRLPCRRGPGRVVAAVARVP